MFYWPQMQLLQFYLWSFPYSWLRGISLKMSGLVVNAQSPEYIVPWWGKNRRPIARMLTRWSLHWLIIQTDKNLLVYILRCNFTFFTLKQLLGIVALVINMDHFNILAVCYVSRSIAKLFYRGYLMDLIIFVITFHQVLL